jgi:hypothetical protein
MANLYLLFSKAEEGQEVLTAHIALRPAHCCFGEMAELAEGARLLSEYMPKRRIEGSNPSLSATFLFPIAIGLEDWKKKS